MNIFKFVLYISVTLGVCVFMCNLYFFTVTFDRYRGDGRNYQIVVLPRPKWDFDQFSGHQFTLYTRGGPYWQIAKIPLSKFYRTYTGFVHTRQSPINTLNMRLMSFTLMDNIEGPFSLELDYIGLYYDNEQSDAFDYEKYICRHDNKILHGWRQ
ncbi:unnamed protein product [Trichobilharzia regenti]|nr:unnamed protein product [Trichobilharzia regenti]